MKKRVFTLICLILGSIYVYSQTTLSFRFANPRIIYSYNLSADGGNGLYCQNLEWDIEMQASAANTRYKAIQFNFTYNELALTDFDFTPGPLGQTTPTAYYNLVPAVTPGVLNLAIVSNQTNTNTTTSRYVLVPTTWGVVGTFRCRITNPALKAGISFVKESMNGQQIQKLFASPYSQLYVNPNTYVDNDLTNLYLGRVFNGTSWSQYGGVVEDVTFLDWSVPQSTYVWWDAATAAITQGDNTIAYANDLYIDRNATLTIAANKWLTVSGTLTNNNVVAPETHLVVANNGSLKQPTAGVVATVTRNIPAGEWHFISAPTSNATSTMFQDQYLQTLNEGTGLYTDIYALGAPLVPGKGYALWSTAGSAVYAGPLNATATFPYTAGGSGWNLVGNPYASSLDWDIAKAGNTDFDLGATYVHRNAALWASYISGVGNNGGSKFIAPGQGFIVKATVPGSLVMNYSAQAHSSQAFYKNTEVVNNLVRLEISGNGYADEAVVRFLPEATAEFDGSWDAYKLYGDVAEAAQFYTLGSEPLAINSLPEAKIVPAGVHAGANGTYTIALTEMNDISEVTLEDTKTATFTDLTKGSYTFDYVAGDNEQRFFLHFGTTGVGDDKATNVSIYSYQKTVYVTLKENVKGDIFIYNMAGQLVSTRTSAVGSNEIKLSNTGNYIVKVITSERTFVGKVFIL